MRRNILRFTFLGIFCWVGTLLAQNNVYDWANKYGSTGTERFLATCVDANGNTFSVGSFSNSITINGTPRTSNGSADILIIKTNAASQTIFGITIGGSGEDVAQTVTYDNGFIYIGGYFSTSVSFDPSSSSGNLISDGGRDGFVLKIDTLGNFSWVRKWGGANHQQINDIAANTTHEIVIAGNFEGTSYLNIGNSSTAATNAGAKDFFVTKLDANGSEVWTRTWGGTGNDEVKGITTSTSNEIILTGYFSDAVAFDTSFSATPATSVANEDLYVLKLANTGHFIWNALLHNTNKLVGYDVAIRNNEIALVGSFSGNISLSAGGVHQSNNSNGFTDLFIAKMSNTNGDFAWLNTAGSNSNEEALAVQFDGLGNVYAAGYFAGTIAFGNSNSLTASGFFDAFAVKYTNSGTCEWAKRFSGTNNEQANDIAVTASFDIYVVGEFNQTVDFDPSVVNHSLTTDGSIDAFIVKLQKCVATTGVHVVTACQKYTWLDGIEYTQNNTTATFTLQGGNHIGCDSILTLNLTINHHAAGVHTVTACQQFTWLNGITYHQNNTTATHTLVGAAANGCDSVLTLNLTIKPLDPTITYKSSTGELIANQPNASYQWINCDTRTAISGATNATYKITESGNFALAVTFNGCTDTSDCISFLDVSVQENDAVFSVFPNPSEGNFQVVSQLEWSPNMYMQVFTTDGKIVWQKNMQSQQEMIDLSHMPAGIYILKIVSNERLITKKLIKK